MCFKKLKQELKKTYRFYFDRGDVQYKEDYKKEEILEMLDKIALAKEQE